MLFIRFFKYETVIFPHTEKAGNYRKPPINRNSAGWIERLVLGHFRLIFDCNRLIVRPLASTIVYSPHTRGHLHRRNLARHARPIRCLHR